MNTNIPRTNRKRIVIVGGGFAGLKVAGKLKKAGYQIVLIDRNNFHQFPPLLYQVASAGLEPSSILFPFRKMFQKRKNFYFRMAEIKSICSEEKRIETSIGYLSYDYLVLATGTTTNFFGNGDIERYAHPMKDVNEALALRNTILTNFEKALVCTDEKERQEYMNIVVVGAGATGVEVSGAIAEMKRFILRKDYPDLDIDKINIYLIEGTGKVLGNMSPNSSKWAFSFLQKMGVTILLEKLVTDYENNIVHLNDGSVIHSRNVIWVSGVKAEKLDGINPENIQHGNRISVDQFNRVQGHTDIFAIGDLACMLTDERYPKGHPQVAQVAIQQGKLLAVNLRQIEKNQPMKSFRYKDKGTMATVGRNKAVADLKGFRLHGMIAWMIWLFVHLMSILGAKNKIFVFINWMWNYFTYDQSLRLIIGGKNGKYSGKN